MTTKPTSSSTWQTPSKNWLAKFHHHQSGKGLVTIRVTAPDFLTAEQYAIAKAAFALSADPTTLHITSIAERP